MAFIEPMHPNKPNITYLLQYKTAYKFTHGYIDAMACARELTILKYKSKQNGRHLTNGISKFYLLYENGYIFLKSNIAGPCHQHSN